MNSGQHDKPQYSETASIPSEVTAENDTGPSMDRRVDTVSGNDLGAASQSLDTESAGFERYRIERMLGSGGFGAVYLGFDKILERAVAIKMPRREQTQAEQQALMAEARRLAQVDHPNILAVYDTGIEDGRCFLVSAYLEGVTVRQAHRRKQVPWEEAANLVAQIADGLSQAHSRGMVHRDIKPGNLMILDEDKRPVILDFGLAMTSIEASASARSMKGTPAYMSPEQVRGGAAIDSRSDIYSLGVVLYELLAGRRPFDHKDRDDLWHAILNDAPTPLREIAASIPKPIAAVCRQAMAYDVSDRFETADEFAVALRSLTAELSATSSEQNSGQRSDEEEDQTDTAQTQPTGSFAKTEHRRVTVSIMNFNIEGPDGPLSQEAQHEAATTFHAMAAACVSNYGGSVLISGGSEVTACFGFPVTFEDAAVRAVRAGLELLTAAQNWQIEDQENCTITTWCAVNTGYAVANVTAPEDGGDISITGEVRHIVARMELDAAANSITVSHATYDLVKAFFETEGGGELQLRGTAEPIQQHRILAAKPAIGRLNLVDPSDLSQLVGRNTELSILTDRWEQALEGLGQVVLLIGEAGLGKSRLIRELRNHVCNSELDAPANIVELRCSAYHQATGYYPIVEYLGRQLGFEQETDNAARLTKLSEYMAELAMPDADDVALMANLLALQPDERFPTPVLSPMRARELQENLLHRWFGNLTDAGPFLFVVEDLHWIDPSTLALLGSYVQQFESGTVLSILTFRPEFQTPWRSFAHQTQIALSRLTKRQTKQLILSKSKRKFLSDHFVEQITERTDGIPLFVEEFAQMLADSSASRNGDPEASESFMMETIPSSLQDLLLGRLDRLNCNPIVVQMAAVIGREFSYELLKVACDIPNSELDTELEKLVTAELLFQKGQIPDANFIFKHALIQDSAYQAPLRKHRQQLHLQLAEAIEVNFPEIAEAQPELIARHLTDAGESARAIKYWLAAGQLAQSSWANTEAIAHLEQGLRLVLEMPESGERDKLELGFRLPLIAVLMGARGYAAPEIKPQHKRVQEIGAGMGDRMLLGQLHTPYWMWVFINGDHQSSQATTEFLLENAEAADDNGLRAEAHWTGSCGKFFVGRFRETMEHSRTVLKVHDRETSIIWAKRTFQNSGPLSQTYLAKTLWLAGETEEAVDQMAQAQVFADGLEDAFTTVVTRWKGAHLGQLMRSAERTEKGAAESLAMAEQLGFAFWLGLNACSLGAAYHLAGDSPKAIETLRKGIVTLKATGTGLLFTSAYTFLAEALWAVGDRNAAWTALADATLHSQTGEAYFEAETHRIRGGFHLAEGDAESAITYFQRSISVADNQGAPMFAIRSATDAAEIFLKQGQQDQAIALLTPRLAALPNATSSAEFKRAQLLLDSV